MFLHLANTDGSNCYYLVLSIIYISVFIIGEPDSQNTKTI